MFDCFGVRFISQTQSKQSFQNDQKGWETRTNMDIILLFLAKPLDKYGTTLVHITYPPLLAALVKSNGIGLPWHLQRHRNCNLQVVHSAHVSASPPVDDVTGIMSF